MSSLFLSSSITLKSIVSRLKKIDSFSIYVLKDETNNELIILLQHCYCTKEIHKTLRSCGLRQPQSHYLTEYFTPNAGPSYHHDECKREFSNINPLSRSYSKNGCRVYMDFGEPNVVKLDLMRTKLKLERTTCFSFFPEPMFLHLVHPVTNWIMTTNSLSTWLPDKLYQELLRLSIGGLDIYRERDEGFHDEEDTFYVLAHECYCNMRIRKRLILVDLSQKGADIAPQHVHEYVENSNNTNEEEHHRVCKVTPEQRKEFSIFLPPPYNNEQSEYFGEDVNVLIYFDFDEYSPGKMDRMRHKLGLITNFNAVMTTLLEE